MSKGAVSSLVFASTAVATSSFGYIFVNSAQQVKVKVSAHNADGKKRRFHLFGKVKDRKSKGKGAKFILSPVRGQHPTIIRADKLDETIGSLGADETDATGTASRARRVQSAPASTLLRLEQQTRAQNEGREQAKLQRQQLNAISPTSPKSPNSHHHHQASPRAPTTPASTNKNKIQRNSRDEGNRNDNNTINNDSTIELSCSSSPTLAAKCLQPPQRIENSHDDDDESDWDEGISAPTPRPLRSSSIAFPTERSLPAERQKELVEQFEKSVKPCENWDDDFDLDVETEALQVPSAVAAAQFSVKMDLYNIHDFAKQIEALKNLRTEVQDISKAISDTPGIMRLETLRHTYLSDWEQAEVIIDLGEIANDENPLAPPIRTVAKPESDTASDFVDFDEIDGPDTDSPVNWGANLPSEKHLDVLKDILRNGLDAEGRCAIQPFLVGDSVQFSVEMMPGLLAHLKRLSGRLEEHLTALRTLQTV